MEMWWLIIDGDVVAHWWRCGGSLVEMWWLTGGDVLTKLQYCFELYYFNSFFCCLLNVFSPKRLCTVCSELFFVIQYYRPPIVDQFSPIACDTVLALSTRHELFFFFFLFSEELES